MMARLEMALIELMDGYPGQNEGCVLSFFMCLITTFYGLFLLNILLAAGSSPWNIVQVISIQSYDGLHKAS